VVHIPYRDPPDGHEFPPEAPYALTVTNFNYWRKVEPLIDAVPLLAPLLGDLGLQWLVLGEGIFLDRCKSLTHPYADCIHFLGRHATNPYYKGNAFCVLYISGLDGLPNVLLEAFAAGLAVIMNHDCPAREFLRHGETGLLVDFRDASCVQTALKILAEDQSFGARIGKKAAAHVLETYSEAGVSKELAEALKACIAEWSRKTGKSHNAGGSTTKEGA